MKETFGNSGGEGGFIFLHKNGNSGEVGGLSWNSLRGGGMDIFWNCTLLVNFPCGILVILILNCGIAVFFKLVGAYSVRFGWCKNLSFMFSAYILVSGCYKNKLKQSFLSHELIT